MKILFSLIFLLISFLSYSQNEYDKGCVTTDTFKYSGFNKYYKLPTFENTNCYIFNNAVKFLKKHPSYRAWIEIHLDTAQNKPEMYFDSTKHRYYPKDKKAESKRDSVSDILLENLQCIGKYLESNGVKNALFSPFKLHTTVGFVTCNSKFDCKNSIPRNLIYIICCPKDSSIFSNLKNDSTLRLENIYFKTGEAQLLSASYNELNELFEYLNKNSQINIEVLGHTDNIGNDISNKLLSENRAKAVAVYLVNKGIMPARITSKGYGESKPIANNDTEEGRSKNRRVEIKIRK